MARRPRSRALYEIQRELVEHIAHLDLEPPGNDLRDRVLELVRALRLFRDLGVSLLGPQAPPAAIDRILCYLRLYSHEVVGGDELAVVSGIAQYARRVRQLRVEQGWPIYSGKTAREMIQDELREAGDAVRESGLPVDEILDMKADQYILLGDQDLEAAARWRTANEIRRMSGSMKNRLLLYLRTHVGQAVTGEELRYVARNAITWPRRTRELRTQEGWPVATRSSGRPDLPVGVYVLEADRQSEPHDRNIPDPVRVAVLERDGHRCTCCGWEPSMRRPGDPRALLELHHISHHVGGGSNDEGNLITLCNVHHDEVHRRRLNGHDEFFDWMRTAYNYLRI